MVMTVWAMLEECVNQIDEPFRRSEIIGWFRRHHPEVKESTLAAHIQAATANATNRAQNNALGMRPPLLRRIDHGLYVRAEQQRPISFNAARPPRTATPPEVTMSAGDSVPAAAGAASLLLIGCVKVKRDTAAPAAELFRSVLFAGRRRYATTTGLPWYILSAKYGLLAPDDVIGPYDVYLADQSLEYRRAWGEFVIAQLERLEPRLHGRTIEVHAGAAYVDPLRGPLSSRGSEIIVPLAHLGQGEQVAWYSVHAPAIASVSVPSGRRLPDVTGIGAQDLARLLTDASQALSPAELLRRGSDGLRAAGMYSWWVDAEGANDLSQGLGQHVAPGLIYIGQAGATRWPSGKRSANTLWGRIAGMHLGSTTEFSTFRRTLAAVLFAVLDLRSEDDPRLSAWINARLRVIAVAVPDADGLSMVESAILDMLDPSLNIRGRPPSPVRIRLTALRRNLNT